LSNNGASDAQASVYLWVGVAIGVYVRAQVCKPGYCIKQRSKILELEMLQEHSILTIKQ